MSAVGYSEASSLALACYKCVQSAQQVAQVNPLALTVRAMCPSFGRCATVEKASPECLEPLFSDVHDI